MRFYLLLFIVFLTLGKEIWAQEPNYEIYTTENGLPSSFIFQMHQDRQHNIWFVTNGGISKYDGDRFRNYAEIDGLKEAAYLNICESESGQLYFLGISKGIYQYDPINDYMVLTEVDSAGAASIRKSHVTSFIADNNGNVNIGFSIGKGFAQISKSGNMQVSEDTLTEGIEINTTENGLFYCSHSRDSLITINGKRISYTNRNSMHLNAVVTEKDVIVLGDEKQLSIIKNERIIETKNFDRLIIALNTDKKGRLWVSFYGGGTICFSLKNDRLIQEKHLLKDYSVTTVLEDHEGGFWISTIEGGVFYTPNINSKFFNLESGVSGSRIVMLTGNGKGEMIAVYANGTITIFESDTIHKTINVFPNEVKSGNYVSGMSYNLPNDEYWISVNDVPLILKNGILKKSGYDSLRTQSILFNSAENAFWFGNEESINYFKDDSITHSFTIAKRSLISITRDLNNDLLLLTRNGFKKIDPVKMEFDENPDVPVVDDNITNLQKLNDSLLLFFGMKGIHIVSKTDTILYSSVQKDGSQVYLYGAQLESENQIWVTSNNGLKKLTMQEDTILTESFSRETGIFHNDQKSIYNNKNALWISTSGGLYIIDKNDINSPTPSAPTIRSISSHDTVYNNPADGIIFQPNEDNLFFQLQAITFKYKDEYSFEYQIDQINNTFWPLTGSELNLTNLGPGDYALKIRIKTTNGIYSPVTSYSFKILTPFWLTWWFFSIIILAFALLVYLIMKRIIRRIRIQERKKSELNELIHSLRLQSIQSQFNPHFTFNAISSIQRHISPNTIDDAKEYLGMFSSIMRAILLNSEKETILVSQELKLLDTYLKLEQLRFGEKLRYEFILDESVDPDYDRLPPMIIQPILENAINYGIFNKPEGGNISIRFAVKNEVLHCEIEDNGIGREAAAVIQTKKKMKGSGKGLKLVRERLMVANTTIKDFFEITDLFDTEGSPMGTKVVLKIELND